MLTLRDMLDYEFAMFPRLAWEIVEEKPPVTRLAQAHWCPSLIMIPGRLLTARVMIASDTSAMDQVPPVSACKYIELHHSQKEDSDPR